MFVGNLGATCPRPGNPWDLNNCRQKADESLWDYIQHFSKHYNELPNIVDADVMSAFLSGTRSQVLIHELGRTHQRTTRELLNIVTSHASGEVAIGALCTRISAFDKGKWNRSDEMGEGSFDPQKEEEQVLAR